jgi:hypothetical protein
MGFLGLGGDKTTTTTNTLGQQDTNYIYDQRAQAERAAAAAQGTQIAGMDPYSSQALDQLGGQYDQWAQNSDFYNQYGQNALNFAGQTGMGGVDQYMNPYIQGVIDPMREQYGYQRDQAMMGGAQQASLAGAYGGSRGSVLQGMALQGINRDEAMQIANLYNQGYNQAGNWMMGERGRMGGLGMGAAGYGQQALRGQQGASDALLRGGDYRRNVQNEMYGQELQNEMNALRALNQGYGKDTKQIQTNVEEGSWLGDALGLATGIGSFFLPGAGAASSALGALGGLGAGSQQIANSPVMDPNANIWNYGQNGQGG